MMGAGRTSVLGLAGVLVPMLLCVGGASAAVEVRDEAANVHCSTITQPRAHTVEGGCLVHATSLIPLRIYQHISTPVVAEVGLLGCSAEFSVRVGESGTGFIVNQVLTDVERGGCGITQCDEVEPSHADRPWPMELEEVGGHEVMEFVFCTRLLAASEGAGTPCVLQLPITGVGHTHTFGPVTQTPCLNTPPGPIIELSGQLQTEGGGAGEQRIEIAHP